MRIRVDPTVLRQSSKNVSGVGTNLSQVGQSALGKASGAPSYDGQFGPRLQAIGYEALARAQGLSGRVNDLAGQLQRKAQAFEAADLASISAIILIPRMPIPIWKPPWRLPFLLPWRPFPWLPKWRLHPFPLWPPFARIPPKPVPTPKPGPPPTPNKPGLSPNPGSANPRIEQDAFKPQPPWSNYYVSGGRFPKYEDGTLHTGIDIKPTPYDPNQKYLVHPIGPGKIVREATEYEKDGKGQFVLDENGNKKISGYGHYVVIEHELSDGKKIYSRYAHLASPSDLTEGQEVGTETELGNMGSSGRSTGAHLHLEIYNPEAYTGYNDKNPDALFNPQNPSSPTYLEKMKQDFCDPEPFLNGKTDIRFKINKP